MHVPGVGAFVHVGVYALVHWQLPESVPTSVVAMVMIMPHSRSWLLLCGCFSLLCDSAEFMLCHNLRMAGPKTRGMCSRERLQADAS